MFPLAIVVQLLTSIYMLACTLDMMIAIHLEKKQLFYPMTSWKCFCGWEIEMLRPRYPVPVRLYKFFKVKRHNRGCLLWILNADFNELTPYFAHNYAAGLREDKASSTLFTNDFYLKMAKRYSRRARAGLDPFGDFSSKDLE